MTSATDHDGGREESQEGSYSVVVNHEGQYSVWRDAKPRPAGWNDGGFRGSYEDCLDHIELVWTDLRPISARGGAE